MQMSAEQTIDAPREAVWQALNDPSILKQCVAGCERLERVGEDAMEAEVVATVGPVEARFKGTITVSDADPPRGYRIAGEGHGGTAGFARGSAIVTLHEDGTRTILRYDVDAAVGGKLAQIGTQLIDATARKFAEDFFSRFLAIVGPAATAAEPAVAETAAAPVSAEETVAVAGVRPLVWVPALILVVLIVMFVWAGAAP